MNHNTVTIIDRRKEHALKQEQAKLMQTLADIHKQQRQDEEPKEPAHTPIQGERLAILGVLIIIVCIAAWLALKP